MEAIVGMTNKNGIIEELYDTNEEKESNFIVNARISISNIISFIEKNSRLMFCEIKKSPISDSLYLEFECLNDSFDHTQTYIVRFSDHYCVGYSNCLIYNFVESSGIFGINKMLLRKLTENKTEVKDRIIESHNVD